MRSPRLCCCPDEPTPARYLLLCNSSLSHCAEQEGGKPPAYRVPDSGTQDEIDFWGAGNIPNVGDVFQTGGGVLGGCWQFASSVPATHIMYGKGWDNRELEDIAGCTREECYRYCIATPCRWVPADEDDALKPHRMIAKESTWHTKLPGGLRCKDPAINYADQVRPSVYRVTGHLTDPYCVQVEDYWSLTGQVDPLTEQDLDVYGGIPGSASFEYVTGAPFPTACDYPQCADLWIFEPCGTIGQDHGYKMAQKDRFWKQQLGLANLPVVGTPSTYAGHWKFKRESGNTQAGCCDGVEECVDFCGTLRPVANDDTDFCFECNAGPPTSPLPRCEACDVGSKIQILCDDSAYTPDYSFELKNPDPTTGNACTRLDCDACPSIDCEGTLVVEGEMIFNFSCQKTYAYDQTVSGGQTVGSGDHNLTLSYSVPYTARLSRTNYPLDACNAAATPYCHAPPWYDAAGREDCPPLVEEWVGDMQINLSQLTISGGKNAGQSYSTPTSSGTSFGNFNTSGTWKKPTSTTEVHPEGGTQVTFPSGKVRITKRFGVDEDVQSLSSGDDACPCPDYIAGSGRPCPAMCPGDINPHDCHVTLTAGIDFWPKCNFSGNTDFTNPDYKSSGSGFLVANNVGFMHTHMVSGDAANDWVACCESDAIKSGKGVHTTANYVVYRLLGTGWNIDEFDEIGEMPGTPSDENQLPHWNGICNDNSGDWGNRWIDSSGSNNCEEGNGEAVFASLDPPEIKWCEGYRTSANTWTFLKNVQGDMSNPNFDNSQISLTVTCSARNLVGSIRCEP